MPPEPPPDGPGYDATTKFLHWVTAALIITQFGLGELWDVWPDHSPTHVMMKSLHYSLGVVLAAVILAHILWRAGWGRHLPPAALGGMDRVARGVHLLLLALIVGMVLSGLGRRWVRGRGIEFFWLFKIPPLVTLDPTWRSALKAFHVWGAWVIIAVAGAHAAAALFHHFVIRDGVLRRMLPDSRQDSARQ